MSQPTEQAVDAALAEMITISNGALRLVIWYPLAAEIIAPDKEDRLDALCARSFTKQLLSDADTDHPAPCMLCRRRMTLKADDDKPTSIVILRPPADALLTWAKNGQNGQVQCMAYALCQSCDGRADRDTAITAFMQTLADRRGEHALVSAEWQAGERQAAPVATVH